MSKSLQLARIIAGSIRWNKYEIRNSSLIDQMIAEEIGFNYHEEDSGWSDKDEKEIGNITKDIEEWKVQIYFNFDTRECQHFRDRLKAANKAYSDLLKKKNELEWRTEKGIAQAAKQKYLVATSLYLDGKKLIKGETQYDNYSDEFISEACYNYNVSRPTEKEIRLIARTEPWRSMWTAGKKRMFRKPTVELTEDQRSLLIWSSVYDNIYSHPDKPKKEIIEDDDALDGWMISQQRGGVERYKDKMNEKIASSDNVMIVPEKIRDIRGIQSLNDQKTRSMLKQGEDRCMNRNA